MGYRAHVCKTFKVEYDEEEWFDYQDNVVIRFLEDEAQAWAPEEMDRVEIGREELSELIQEMTDPANREYYEKSIRRHHIEDTSLSEMRDILAQWLEKADKDNDIIHVVWF